MSDTKWTPGDWSYGVRRDGSIWISRGNPATGPHYQSDFCGTVHDAALTCAAKDLYEALEEAVEQLGSNCIVVPSEWTAALKKARGEA